MKHCCWFSCHLSIYLTPKVLDRNYSGHFWVIHVSSFAWVFLKALTKYFHCMSIKQSFMNYMVRPCRQLNAYDFLFLVFLFCFGGGGGGSEIVTP